MYYYLSKGLTIGHLLTRLLLRTIAGIPGMLIDAIVAIFWIPNYFSYWKDAKIPYADGTTVGFFQGLTGWVGEILGFIIGPVIGAIISLIIGAVDSILWFARAIQKIIYNALNNLASLVGERSFFENFPVYDNPNNYFEKSWNLGIAFIGLPLVAIPYILAKGIEFFIPVFGSNLSWFTTETIGFISGLAGSLIAIPVFPAAYLIERVGQLYDLSRIWVRNLVALIYAKRGEEPTNAKNQDCIPAASMHSEEFCGKVEEYKQSSWTELLLGTEKSESDKSEEADASCCFGSIWSTDSKASSSDQDEPHHDQASQLN